MTKARFSEEFKEEAVKQVIERGYTVLDVAMKAARVIRPGWSRPNGLVRSWQRYIRFI